jgi:hypothetical protein
MNRLLQTIVAGVVLLTVVFLLGSTAWKADQKWRYVQACFCGHDTAALFSTHDEYVQAQIVSSILQIIAVVVGLVLLIIFRPIGSAILAFVCGLWVFAFFTQLNPSDVYVQAERDTALFGVFLVLVASIVMLAVERKTHI